MFEELKIRIRELEAECARLRTENEELKRTKKPSGTVAVEQDECSGDQLDRLSSPERKVELFRALFRGREDVYPVRWENQHGKVGYSPDFDRSRGFVPKEKREFLPMSDEVVHAHLSGKVTAGVYPLLLDDTCWFLAADFDKKTWKQDCLVFMDSCDFLGVPASLECSRSCNGGHVWIFFQTPVNAGLARRLGSVILTRAMESRPELGLDSYDRFFPSQDTLPKGGFGNLIALPMQKHPRQHGGSVFINRNFDPYEDQWSYLASVERVSAFEAEDIVTKAESMGDLLGVRRSLELDSDNDAPWELKPSENFCTEPIAGTLPEKIQVVRSNLIFIQKDGLPPGLINRMIRLAAFHNPEFYQAQAMRFSTFGKPRLVHCAEDFPRHIALPRGCLQDLETLCGSHQVAVEIEDKRVAEKSLELSFSGELRADQNRAVREVLKYDEGVICAATAFGKTVVAAYLIARRQVNTLVIVHRRQLLDQWKERLSVFLQMDPKDIGQIGGGKSKPTGVVDIAIIQSLNRKNVVKDLVADYGYVIVDECHHISAASFEQVMRKTKARFVTGLTATPERKDGHHPITFMQCGPIRFRMSAMAQAKLRAFRYRVHIRPTRMRFDLLSEKPAIHEIYRLLMEDERRNRQIIEDVCAALKEGRSPLILTERKEHIHMLEELLEPHVQQLIVLKGGMGKKQREEADRRLKVVGEAESRAIIATGRYIGEGFDDSRLDTLFLALPISWKGTLQQYVGRLHRLHAGKEEVRVYDYVDEDSPMLSSMFRKRMKGYRDLGYEIHDGEESLDFISQ